VGSSALVDAGGTMVVAVAGGVGVVAVEPPQAARVSSMMSDNTSQAGQQRR
jgi:hypothetical protein